jgi:hypothetical protein
MQVISAATMTCPGLADRVQATAEVCVRYSLWVEDHLLSVGALRLVVAAAGTRLLDYAA